MAAARSPLSLVVFMALAHRGGGAENMLWTFLKRVDRSRIEPTVVFAGHGDFVGEVAAHGIRTLIVKPGDRHPVIVSAAARIASVMRTVDPAVALTWMPENHLHTVAGARLARSPARLMWWQHNLAVPTLGERLTTLAPADAVGASSHAIAGRQQRIWPHRKTFVTHPGIDTPALLTSGRREELRSRHHLPGGVPVIGIVGRLQRWKGQHLLLEALATLRARGREVHGLFVGGDSHELEPDFSPELQHLTDALNLRAHVTFTGHVDDASDYLQLMDVAVNASAEEPFGIVFLEAMALGIPIVGVAAGGPLEIVGESQAALLVDAPEPARFADAIERILTDPGTARRLGDAGRRRHAEAFTAEHMTAGIANTVERVGLGVV